MMDGSKIYCDASYSPITGNASIGVYIQNVCSYVRPIEAKDSMHAERLAIMWAMRIAKGAKIYGTVHSDCLPTVKAVHDLLRDNSKTIKQIRKYMKMQGYKLKWIRRNKNKVADEVSRRFNP